MRKSLWLLLLLLILIASHFFQQDVTAKATLQEIKAEAAAQPEATPEGNTTFLGGTTWCVARPGVSEADLQVALDWACGVGNADCGAIQMSGPCFEPDNLVSHASYAFNSFYQQNGDSDIACYFGGTAFLTLNNPSYAKCVFAASESLKSSSATPSKYMGQSSTLIDVAILLISVLLLCIYPAGCKR